MKTIKNRSLRNVFAAAFALFVVFAFAMIASAQSKISRPQFAERTRAFSLKQAESQQVESVAQTNRTIFADSPSNASNYTFATSTSGTFTDMTGSTQLVGPGNDDAASPNTPIGFDFWLLGNRYSQFNATSNGFIGLSSTGTAVTSTTYTIIGGSTTTPRIAAMGGDLETGAAGGKVHYKVTGAAPNRVLTVEFLNMSIVYNGTTSDGSFQVRLHETTGQIEFVYGAMNRNSATGLDGNGGNLDIGFTTAAANNALVSIVSATNTATTTTPFTEQMYTLSSPIANLDSPGGDGTRRLYSLTPPAVTAPGGPLTFTAVTPIAMTLNWTDSPDETNYGIYRSTDNVNFTFVGTAALNATSFNATGLSPNTPYFWQVRAISDGSVSSALTGSQATTAPGVVTSTAAGGLWSSTATWAGGVVPTNTDDVTIASGATVTIDTAAVALDVTVASGGTLLWDAAVARTLTTGLNVTVASGGTFSSAATGTVLTHVLSVGGDLTNNGTLDFSTNGNTAGAGITFTTATNNTFGGTGGTTNIRTMTLVKGANTNVLELNPSNFTVQGVNTDVAGFLTITSGMLKISGNFTMTNRTFAIAGYAIPAAGGFWLNNPNYTVAAQNGTGTVTGRYRLTQGTHNQGTAAGNALAMATGSNTTIEGGTLTSSGRVAVVSATNTITYTQTGGIITVCTVGNTSTTLGSFDLGTSASSNVTLSGGTIICQLHATGGIDYRYDADPTNLTGTVVQLGNASTPAAIQAFSLRGVLPNLVITNTTAAHTATFNGTLVNFYHVITGNVTINTGNTLNLAGDLTSVNTFFEGNILNNGTLNASNVNMSCQMVGTGVQTYSGTGTMTAPTTDMNIDGGGVDFTGAVNQQVIARINLFSGSLTGADKVTLGNGGATSGIIQIGNGGPPATSAGPVTGTIVNNAGTGGYQVIYGDVDADRSTGGEIPSPRTVSSVAFDTEGANITLAGGDLTATAVAFGDVADTGTNGRVITGANTLIVASGGTVTRVGGLGHVDGKLQKTTVAGAQSFEVGTANGYSPVDANVTAGTGNVLTASATQGAHPVFPSPPSLTRFWTAIGPGVTADMTFHYLAGDAPAGWPTGASVYVYDGTTSTLVPGGTIDTGLMTLNAPNSALRPASGMTPNVPTRDFVGGAPGTALAASSAVSRKVHGGFGPFDINLPLSGSPGIECRGPGGGTNPYQVRVNFANPITSVNGHAVPVPGDATLTGTGSVSAITISGSTVVVDLTGVATQQQIGLTLLNVSDGANSGNIAVPMIVLVGDSAGTGNNSVNSGDIAFVKSKAGAAVIDGTNFRADIAVSGTINASDISLVKSKSGNQFP